jgi:superfamily II DNA or RNA helicase
MSKTKDQIQEEALNAIGTLQRAGARVSVGVGKTLIGLKHMNKNYSDNARFLVVAPKLAIHDEWKAECITHKLTHLINHMEFSTYLSLDKQDLDYDVIYLDECHSLKYSHEPWLNNYKGMILGLTGSPPKFSSSEKGKMVGKFCPIIYKYLTDTAIEDKILNDYRIIVHRLPLDITKNIIMHKNGATWFTSERAGYDYWTNRLDNANSGKEVQIMRIMRMKALQNLKSKERLAKKLFEEATDKVILFADTKEQADNLCLNSYHSSNPGSEQNLVDFKEGKIMKLSCVLQLSEGVNIPNLKVGIIMHAYGNETKSTQRIGRLVRLNPKDTSLIHILCYENTVDEQWVKQALEAYDKTKITWK